MNPEERAEWSKKVDASMRELEAKQYQTKPEDFWPYIYVLKCGLYFKIGITQNAYKRRRQIQTGNPFPVELVFSLRHPKAAEIEKKLHLFYKKVNHMREWFILDDKEVDFIKYAVQNYGHN